MRKILSVLLVIVLIFTAIPLGELELNVSAVTEITESTFNSKYNEFKSNSKYADGNIYTNNPSGSGGYECFGYANEAAKYIFGSYPTTYGAATANINANWSIIRGESAIDKLHIGDIVRYRVNDSYDHSIFVYKISDNTVYYTDANASSTYNKIASRSTTKSELKSKIKKTLLSNSSVVGYVAHYKYWETTPTVYYLTVRYNANGGKIQGADSTIYKYTVVEDAGINLRSGAGTSYSDLNTIPKGTSFTVSATKTANGYTWGQTTYNGKTGWCVISESWTTKTKIPASTYYTNDSGMVCRSISSEYHTNNLACGTDYPNGFVNASTLGLVRDGYTFLGWSKTKTDSRIYDEDEGFKPEDIVSEVKNSNQTITMYAQWEEIVTLNSIEIFNLPKTEYVLGEALDISGLQLLLKHSNNTQSVVSDGFTVTGYDCTKTGEQTLTVSYENKKAYFDIVVLKNYISGDIDGDESINLNDLVTIAQYTAGWGNLEINQYALDVNGDDVVNLQDVTHFARYLAGWDEIVLH